ncbi:MAG: GreA/GreB family elongation factor [Vicingaceae bacterium]|jgi:regulator of nucleoside diphosphate kinase|nr:GreA/GreB family elongation factor [Vicingaceae bacterium]
MKPIISKKDYNVLQSIITGHQTNLSTKETNGLKAELEKAEIVNENEVDSKTIQLNTLFEVEDIATKKTWNLILTLPNEVNIKECKVSVFSPFGVALIGFSEGMIIECKLPSGSKKLKILKVNTK